MISVWFWCAVVDNYDATMHCNTPSASDIIIADNARVAFELASKQAKESLPSNCTFTITQFNKVS